jgi:DNA-binding ferritin-like protein
LIRGQIQPAERSLAEALRSLDAQGANPASGYTLAKLVKDRPGLDKVLKDTITELSTANTKIGKTIKSALESPKKSR